MKNKCLKTLKCVHICKIHPWLLTAQVNLSSVLIYDISDVTMFIQMTLSQEIAIISPNVSFFGILSNLICLFEFILIQVPEKVVSFYYKIFCLSLFFFFLKKQANNT